jgi:hypothetical protein
MYRKTSKLTAIAVVVAAAATPGALAIRMPDLGPAQNGSLKPLVFPRSKAKPATSASVKRTLILPAVTPVLAGSPRGGAITVD